jgi:predicted nucleic acid-binding protein
VIFVDSSYFIAIADQKDQWHERAKKLSTKLHNKPVITDLVLSESVTAVGARGGGKAGMTLYEYIIDNCEVVCMTMDMLEKAMEVFLKYNGNLSLADAASVAVMRSRDITSILSFDEDFDRVAGITRLA